MNKNTEYQRVFKAKKKALGLHELRGIYATQEHAVIIKNFAKLIVEIDSQLDAEKNEIPYPVRPLQSQKNIQ